MKLPKTVLMTKSLLKLFKNMEESSCGISPAMEAISKVGKTFTITDIGEYREGLLADFFIYDGVCINEVVGVWAYSGEFIKACLKQDKRFDLEF